MTTYDYDVQMAARRVEDHVKGWVQRSYLKADGWWAQLVLDEFSFLFDLGYSLTGDDWVGIHFHQKGHYIWFAGPRRDVVVKYDPDDPQRMTIGADVVEPDPPRFKSLDDLIIEHLPEARLPEREQIDRSAVEVSVRWWADGLRQIAPAVL